MGELGLLPLSMDSVIDEDGQRLVEHIRGTSWNAVWAGFQALKKTYPDFDSPNRRPIKVLVVGAGPVGRYAAEAATKYGDVALHKDLLKRGIPGVIVQIVGRNVTQDQVLLKALMAESDMLVDTTSRKDPTQYIFANELIGVLPEHAVVVDATADPYLTDTDSIQVKAIEGIPTGNLDEFEFPPDHPAFDQLPPEVRSDHRRMTVSCYSWPGLKAASCMRRYGRQLWPFLRILLRKPYRELLLESNNYFEQALCRSTLRYYQENLA